MRKVDTTRIEKLLQFVVSFFNEYGRVPTYVEITKGMAYKSNKTLNEDIKRLKERGDLVGTRGKISLSDKLRIKLQGSPAIACGVKCGYPSEAIGDIEGHVILPTLLFGDKGDKYIFRADGNSMEGVGIHDQDWIIVHKQNSANVGDVVIAIIEGGESTCKILKKDDKGYYLQAANSDYPEIRPDCEWSIFGVVKQVIHNM